MNVGEVSKVYAFVSKVARAVNLAMKADGNRIMDLPRVRRYFTLMCQEKKWGFTKMPWLAVRLSSSVSVTEHIAFL